MCQVWVRISANFYCFLSKQGTCVRLHPTLCNPVDYNPPDSSVPGISQARILEWVASSSSRGSSWPKDQTRISCISCIGRWILYHWATWLSKNIWAIIANYSKKQEEILSTQTNECLKSKGVAKERNLVGDSWRRWLSSWNDANVKMFSSE